jgi:hypothetical protein
MAGVGRLVAAPDTLTVILPARMTCAASGFFCQRTSLHCSCWSAGVTNRQHMYIRGYLAQFDARMVPNACQGCRCNPCKV